MFHFTVLHVSSSSGDGEIRTLDPLLARQVLSQLSYTPTNRFLFLILLSGLNLFKPMGLSGPFPICSWLSLAYLNGLKWTRTTDLTLIRRAL